MPLTEISHFIPVGDRLCVELEPFNAPIGRVMLPDNYKKEDYTIYGVIVSQGLGKLAKDGVSRHPVETKVGDRIAFSCYAGNDATNDFLINGKRCRVIRHEDVMAVVNKRLEGTTSDEESDWETYARQIRALFRSMASLAEEKNIPEAKYVNSIRSEHLDKILNNPFKVKQNGV